MILFLQLVSFFLVSRVLLRLGKLYDLERFFREEICPLLVLKAVELQKQEKCFYFLADELSEVLSQGYFDLSIRKLFVSPEKRIPLQYLFKIGYYDYEKETHNEHR